ncbi:tol-pal system protein YbgF [Thauera linaloolentis]|uniref:Cell division coordinator CpoB n=1 Tax=Thauera linaloolentis (strain DSM 12138 / JCM 21573 / CCUG 41526 / CIP 105981 / IAM 15112 / NBRC 102519 / 47Lol) TaxID=1123367 RepID=N6YDP3_THAL4|nr:tol-pal system protein YbgF [Thauera linaloolentis]ENO89665.1 tol-pal system protein YbgF [Thauera linaloolentis 47Lol = DSM 12138]MCM8567145.1 tol-pal system protein YbgF [Thauera linaloolentis]
MKRLLPLAAILILSSAGPAQAGLFDDAEARRQITDMRQDVESRLETTSRGQLELANQNEQLRAEVARLRGQIELLVNEVETLKQRQRDFYVDLDTRLRQIETVGPASGAGDPAAESADYEAALNLLKDGKHREALTAFDAFTTQYPAGSFSAGAHFWAGNAALQTKDINAATKHFNTVLTKWPNDNVAPDALLGLANSQQSIGDAATSRRTLQTLVERYPQSNAAQVARQRLGQR